MYTQIFNPKTGRNVSIYGKKGREILENYIRQNGGSTSEGESKKNRDSTGVINYTDPSIIEMIEREENYVKTIAKLIDSLPMYNQILEKYVLLRRGYKKNLKKDAKKLLKNKALLKMKNALMHLYFVHKDEILRVFKTEHVCSNMGLKRLFEKLTKHYIIYGKLFEDAYTLLTKLNGYFKSLGESELYGFLHISLIKPLQQLPRYPLHYKEIIKRNKKIFNSRRIDNCKNVLELLKDVSQDFNNGLKAVN